MNSSLQEKLDQLPFHYLEYNQKEYENYRILFETVEDYAMKRNLENTLLALYIVRGILMGSSRHYPFGLQTNKVSIGLHFSHCLNVADLLIHLHLHLPDDAEDIVLAATIIHVLPEVFDYGFFLEKKFKQYGLDHQVYEIVQTNYRNHQWSEQKKNFYYEHIEQNQYALIVKLADRANVLEQMYNASHEQVHFYVRDTKKYFYPMCIYGKAHYKERYYVFAILMEKIKCLVDVAEMLSRKHEERMDAFNNELLSLQEDQARLKRMIRELRENALLKEQPGK